jgi:hypothetical protein
MKRRRRKPLTPALSPEYRGEGVKAAAYPNRALHPRTLPRGFWLNEAAAV